MSIKDELELLSCPGDSIKETMEHLGWNFNEFSSRMNMSSIECADLLEGEAILSTQIADQLAQVLGIPASFWLNREYSYRKKLKDIHNTIKFHNKIWSLGSAAAITGLLGILALNIHALYSSDFFLVVLVMIFMTTQGILETLFNRKVK